MGCNVPLDINSLGWEARRKLAYQYKEFRDVNLPHTFEYISDAHVVKQTIKFFIEGSELIYPAKSYFVAIVYAACLEKYFKVPFFSALSEINLLPDDDYFTSYMYKPDMYDEILNYIGDIWQYKSIEPTVAYFKEEFLIEDED